MPNGLPKVNGLTLLICCVLIGSRGAWAFVECINAPNCSDKRRGECNTAGTVPNACGNCIEGTHGALGPTNTQCLLNESCAMIFPGQTGCPSDGDGLPAPFVVPFDRCACDVGGLLWPTSPGSCAHLSVSMPKGSGIYTLKVCQSKTCEPSACTILASWTPTVRPFKCETRGVDSVILSDGCSLLQNLVKGFSGMSMLCGHPGLQAIDPMGREQQFPPPCQLAPKCPESVLANTRLEQTCCDGNRNSHPLMAWGRNEGLPAPGFCSASATAFGCPVVTAGPGWRGCACLNGAGVPDNNKICTVECKPPGCPLPAGGIRATPEKWLTSQVPEELIPPERAAILESSAWRRASETRFWIFMIPPVLNFMA